MNYSVLLKSKKKWFYPLLLLHFFVFISCTKEEDNSKDEDMIFNLTSEDLDCSNDGNYLVPFSGKTYTISVTASENVKWNVDVTSKDLMTTNIEGEQSGNGTIELTAAPNPEKIAGRTATVVINSTVKETKRTFTFEQKEKRLYFPENTEGQTAEDFKNPNSKYNIYYMKEGENVAIFWDKSLGLKPSRFDEDRALEEADKAFRFLQNEVGFAQKASNPANTNKFLIFINKDDQGSAYGGGDHGVGKIWLGPNHLEGSERNDRYGIYYHEMCHCFQFMGNQDGAGPMSGPINEMTSQYAMVQQYRNWMELEPGHVNAFMRLTHLALGHEANGYHAPWVLEYWENVYGPHFIPKIWEESKPQDNSDFVAAYQRLTGLDQEKFCDELFEAYCHFITWDVPSIKEESKDFINKHSCKLTQKSNTYNITSQYCPQNYGYNGIKLQTPKAGTKITLSFNGLFTTNGYKVENKDEACWRFGFVAFTTKGERIYGNMVKTTNNRASLEYDVPSDVKDLWLVVMASPKKHRKHVIDNSLGENQEQRIYNQWPYQITLLNAEIDNTFIE